MFRVLAIDISPTAIELAKANAKAAGVGVAIAYRVEDILKLSSPVGSATLIVDRGYFHILASKDRQTVMLDVRFPGPDGFKLCRRIRSEEKLREAPILFLTSCEDDETYIKHLDVGGTGFVTKPINKKKLLVAIGELVDGHRSVSGA